MAGHCSNRMKEERAKAGYNIREGEIFEIAVVKATGDRARLVSLQSASTVYSNFQINRGGSAVMPSISLNINGSKKSVTVESLDMPLLWVLRDSLGLTGTKYGCGDELCGACAVLINGKKQLACDVDVGEAAGASIWTIEGLAADLNSDNPRFPSYAKVRDAWIETQVPQCGFCQSGMLIAAVSLLESGKSGRVAARMIDHVCVCGTYPRINKALRSIS